ncbi:MAG: rhodanese-like domain-containing protein, partial [Thermodesulfobacteriota bacterium]
MAEYIHPEVLVSAQWVADHANDPNVRIVESDEDVLLYEVGHIENAIKIDWQIDLQDQLIRDYIDKEKFEKLLSDKGISNDSTVVFYGDKSNWWACYAMWVFKLFGHENCLIMNGGRQKWIEEERPITKDVPNFPKTDYKVSRTNDAIRAFRDDVVKHIGSGNPLID